MIGVGKIKQYTDVLGKPRSKGKQEGFQFSLDLCLNPFVCLMIVCLFSLLLTDLPGMSFDAMLVSLNAFSFLFSVLVQYSLTQVDNIAELERRCGICSRGSSPRTSLPSGKGKQEGNPLVGNPILSAQHSVEGLVRKGLQMGTSWIAGLSQNRRHHAWSFAFLNMSVLRKVEISTFMNSWDFLVKDSCLIL